MWTREEIAIAIDHRLEPQMEQLHAALRELYRQQDGKVTHDILEGVNAVLKVSRDALIDAEVKLREQRGIDDKNGWVYDPGLALTNLRRAESAELREKELEHKLAIAHDAIPHLTGKVSALELREKELREALQMLPLDSFEGEMGSHDAAEFVDHAGEFFAAMVRARAVLSDPSREGK